MYAIISFTAFVLLLGNVLAAIPFETALPCMTQPVLQMHANDALTFELLNGTAYCEMILSPADPNYVPISVTVIPANCSGNQLARFNVPAHVATGLLSIQWQCEGQGASSCNLVNVTDGLGDIVQYAEERGSYNAFYSSCSSVKTFKRSNRKMSLAELLRGGGLL